MNIANMVVERSSSTGEIAIMGLNLDVSVGYVVLRPSAEEAMKRAMARDKSELVDPEPISHMYDSFSDLGDYERFVVHSTGLNVAETVATVVARISDNQQVLDG